MDVRCFDDLDPLATEIDDPLEELDQDNHHRLITPPGQNLDDPDLGFGIQQRLSGSTEDIASIAPGIEAEFRKDERNEETRATLTPLGSGEYSLSIRVKPNAEVLGIAVTEDLIMTYRASAARVDRV